MAKALIFYSTASAASLAAAFSVLLTRDEYKLVDCAGADAAAILVLLQAEVANAADYDKIYVCMDKATFSVDNLAELHSIIPGTTVLAGDVQANSTTTAIKLSSAASAANDFYNGMFVTDGTLYRYISDYVGSTKVATIADTTSAITTPSTFLVYTLDDVVFCSGTFNTEDWWKLVYSGVNVPDLMYWLKGSTAYRASSTGVGTYNSTTVTSSHTANKYNKDVSGDDYFVLGLHTAATSGANQIKRIKSNTATVITLDEAWDVLPQGNLAFYIDRPRNMFSDLYFGYAIPTYLKSVSTIGTWRLLLDAFNDLADSDCKQTYYDQTTYDELRAKGKVIFDAVKAGVVS